MTITVAVADDQALLASGLCGIIDTASDLTVVGVAATGVEAIAVVRKTNADLVLMDIRMPEMNGLQATREIVSTTDTKVVILTTFDLDEYIFDALRAGASGFLLKDTPPGALLDAIRVVASGEALLAPAVTKRLIDEFAAQPESPAPRSLRPEFSTITARELEVLRLVAAGLSNSEIADRLHIGHGTAKTHVGHLLTKLNARDRVQLVIIAYRNGLESRP